MYPTKAYGTKGFGKQLAPIQINRRKLRPFDVLIDIHYCGICHSDIHQVRNEWDNAKYPMIPGHEITGIVSKVGARAKKFKIGDRVGVGCLVDSCRKCIDCKKREEQFCDHPVWTYNAYEKNGKTLTFGGYSTQIVVDQDFVLKIPKNIPLDLAAPLLCAGITTYSPLRHWKVGRGAKVAIVGLGGLGHVAVKLARAMGAHVSVLSHSPKKKKDALKLGAHQFYSTRDPKIFDRLKRRFHLILNSVSVELEWDKYFGLLERDGALVLLGVPEKRLSLSAFDLILGRKHFAGSLIGGTKETQEMLNFCGKYNITPDIELISIQKVNEAYRRVVSGDVRYRFVIDLASLKYD